MWVREAADFLGIHQEIVVVVLEFVFVLVLVLVFVFVLGLV